MSNDLFGNWTTPPHEGPAWGRRLDASPHGEGVLALLESEHAATHARVARADQFFKRAALRTSSRAAPWAVDGSTAKRRSSTSSTRARCSTRATIPE